MKRTYQGTAEGVHYRTICRLISFVTSPAAAICRRAAPPSRRTMESASTPRVCAVAKETISRTTRRMMFGDPTRTVLLLS